MFNLENNMDSVEFTCICGEQRGWISHGQELGLLCSHCGRGYKEMYNSEKLTIEHVEIERVHTPDRWTITPLMPKYEKYPYIQDKGIIEFNDGLDD